MDFDSTWKILGPAHAIMFKYCERYRITFDDLRGRSRKQPLARIRQDCMAEVYHNTKLSTTNVGRLFDRDHTTIIHGIRASEARQ